MEKRSVLLRRTHSFMLRFSVGCLLILSVLQGACEKSASPKSASPDPTEVKTSEALTAEHKTERHFERKVGGNSETRLVPGKLRVLVIGAHPDDAEIRAGGTALKFVARGDKVRFVSVTNGDAGHQSMSRDALAKRRAKEAQRAAERSGAQYVVLNNHDGELEPTFEVRKQIIKQIRDWQADIVITHRPSDYHPDHRYTSILVQDAAFMVAVPLIVPETPALRHNPIFLYLQDEFEEPKPFQADVVVATDDIIDKKHAVLDAHESQVYEFLPWIYGYLSEVPQNASERLSWLHKKQAFELKLNNDVRNALEHRYGHRGKNAKHAEAFELCEYGTQISNNELSRLFPK